MLAARAVVEAVAPRRLGREFRWLLSSYWVSNLGDGFALAAGPLLVASSTSDPTLVGLATLLQRLPWLLFALPAGGTTETTVRQRATPPELQGRASSINRLGSFAGLTVGAGIGGPVASTFGITAPFWFAFGGSALLVVLLWRQMRHIAV